MNLREGMRRLALVLGVVGAIGGGFFSYFLLQPSLEQSADHKRFEQLANSDVVQQERKSLQTLASLHPSQPVNVPNAAIPMMTPAGVRMIPPEKQAWALKNGAKPVTKMNTPAGLKWIPNDMVAQALKAGATIAPLEPPPPGFKLDASSGPGIPPPPPGFKLDTPSPAVTEWDAQGNPIKSDWNEATPLPSRVDKGDIATINWSKGKSYRVSSIETENGQTLYPTPAPSTWSYVGIAVLPLLGFFVPWGVVRAIGWVGAGFVAGPK